jgi:predicted nucleotide-binding protein (sugar kinase/HSP70/actin superfamily)
VTLVFKKINRLKENRPCSGGLSAELSCYKERNNTEHSKHYCEHSFLSVPVSGEKFCRLSTFSNDDLARKIEDYGGEAWVTDMGEWVYYSNYWEMEKIRSFENPRSMRGLGWWLSDRIQHRNEHELSALFSESLTGWEEPHQVKELVDRGARYLDPHASMGEMILNLGKRHGCIKKARMVWSISARSAA